MKRALVVDDERGAHHVLSAVLRKVGSEVTTALSGGEALKQLLGFPFSVVLLDVRMPRLDGMEVLRRIEQQQPELPVIIRSGPGRRRDQASPGRGGRDRNTSTLSRRRGDA
ncbi:MAG: response regulator [Nitrospinota bacterium]